MDSAAAFGPRFFRRRGAKEARPEPGLGKDRWRAGLPHCVQRSIRREGDQIRSPCRLTIMNRSSITTRAGHEPDCDLADLGHLSRSQLRDLWQKEVGEKMVAAAASANCVWPRPMRRKVSTRP